MRILLDTHLLLWMSIDSPRLSDKARQLILDPGNEVCFSVASVWEITIKNSSDKKDFQVDPVSFRQELLAHGFTELSITGQHVQILSALPPIHKDPFDRVLIAQAVAEGMTLLTADKIIAGYSGPVFQV